MRKHFSRATVLLMMFLLAFYLTSCATLQQKWDKATEDEKARIFVSQTEKTLKTLLVSGEVFVEANPKYKEEWKAKVLPMFKAANAIVGDLIQKGMAGQTLTSTQVLTAIAGRIKEITDALAAWGVTVAETEYLRWKSVARLC